MFARVCKGLAMLSLNKRVLSTFQKCSEDLIRCQNPFFENLLHLVKVKVKLRFSAPSAGIAEIE